MGAIFRLIMASVLCWMTASGIARAGETIHTWTDNQGIRHFSTTSPSEDASNQKVYIKEDKDSGTAPRDNARRKSFDTMVNEARTATIRLEQERSQAEAQRQQQEKEAAEKRRRKAFETKRQELRKQIDALMGRALSPTFSKGMRDSQIKAIEEKIEKLEKEAGLAQNSQ